MSKMVNQYVSRPDENGLFHLFLMDLDGELKILLYEDEYAERTPHGFHVLRLNRGRYRPQTQAEYATELHLRGADKNFILCLLVNGYTKMMVYNNFDWRFNKYIRFCESTKK